MAALCLAMTIPSRSKAADPGTYHVSAKFDVDGMGNVPLEYHNHVLGPMAVDRQTHRLYVTRTTDTAVFDGSSGALLSTIPGMTWAQGIVLVPRAGRGFVSDSGAGLDMGPNGARRYTSKFGPCIVVFDLKTSAVIGRLPMPQGIGHLAYDSFSDRVWTFSGRRLVRIRPDTDFKSADPVGPVEFSGTPGSFAFDGAGNMFVALTDKDAVAVLDLKEMKVRSRFVLAPKSRPSHLAVDPVGQHLFMTCNQNLVILSAQDGRALASFVIGPRGLHYRRIRPR
jgi:DNA-binding beta-propeller fold protein YncE